MASMLVDTNVLIWIAASAIEKGYVLATHDEHFSQIPMLRLVE